MENLETSQLSEQSFTDDNKIRDYLLETAKWGRFLAIVGYVGIVLIVIIAIVMMIGFSALGSISDTDVPMWILGGVYLIMALIYYFPVSYLFRFSDRMKYGLQVNDKQAITTGFMNLKSLYKFFGIFTIVMLSLYALILVIALPMAIFFAR